MDQTTRDLPADGNPHRSRQKQVRAHQRTCALAPATDHPQAAGETAGMHENRSPAPRPGGQAGSRLAASPHHSFNPTRGSRGPRELFRMYWKHRSKAPTHKPKVAPESMALIREMATNNRLWGAERIRGELLKLGLRICKRTIQKSMRTVRTQQPRGQKWSTFLHNHAAQVWACDALSGHRSLLSAAFCLLQHPRSKHDE